jgi:hypothetical protein
VTRGGQLDYAVALPAGFQPDQVTMRVVDAKSGALLGARTLIVR